MVEDARLDDDLAAGFFRALADVRFLVALRLADFLVAAMAVSGLAWVPAGGAARHGSRQEIRCVGAVTDARGPA